MQVNGYKTNLLMQINVKNAQLAKIDKENLLEESKNLLAKEDYFFNNGILVDKNSYEEVLNKLKNKDKEIKSHEQSHAQGSSTPHYNYQVGPDGKLYAVGGYVELDMQLPKNKDEAILKLEQLKHNAYPINNPSSADMSIISKANIIKAKLLQEGNDENSIS